MLDKTKSWLVKLWNGPWWGKPLCILVGILVLALSVLAVISRLYSRDYTGWKDPKPVVDTALSGYEDQEKVLAKLIAEKKKILAIHINQASLIDKQTLEKRKKLEEATTMEELDKLQEELGL